MLDRITYFIIPHGFRDFGQTWYERCGKTNMIVDRSQREFWSMLAFPFSSISPHPLTPLVGWYCPHSGYVSASPPNPIVNPLWKFSQRHTQGLS